MAFQQRRYMWRGANSKLGSWRIVWVVVPLSQRSRRARNRNDGSSAASNRSTSPYRLHSHDLVRPSSPSHASQAVRKIMACHTSSLPLRTTCQLARLTERPTDISAATEATPRSLNTTPATYTPSLQNAAGRHAQVSSTGPPRAIDSQRDRIHCPQRDRLTNAGGSL